MAAFIIGRFCAKHAIHAVESDAKRHRLAHLLLIVLGRSASRVALYAYIWCNLSHLDLKHRATFVHFISAPK